MAAFLLQSCFVRSSASDGRPFLSTLSSKEKIMKTMMQTLFRILPTILATTVLLALVPGKTAVADVLEADSAVSAKPAAQQPTKQTTAPADIAPSASLEGLSKR